MVEIGWIHILKFTHDELACNENLVYLKNGLYFFCKEFFINFYQELERHGRTMRLPSIPERTIKFQRVEIQPGEEPLPIS